MNLLERMCILDQYRVKFIDPGVPPKIYGMQKRRHKYKRK